VDANRTIEDTDDAALPNTPPDSADLEGWTILSGETSGPIGEGRNRGYIEECHRLIIPERVRPGPSGGRRRRFLIRA